jgi:hypothetical protein
MKHNFILSDQGWRRKVPDQDRAIVENVGPVGVHAGQRSLAEDRGGRLDLPEQLLGLGVAAVVQLLHVNDVQPALGVPAVVGFDRPHAGEAVADPDGLADLRYVAGCGHIRLHWEYR